MSPKGFGLEWKNSPIEKLVSNKAPWKVSNPIFNELRIAYEWKVTPGQWFDLPEDERVYMAAYVIARNWMTEVEANG